MKAMLGFSMTILLLGAMLSGCKQPSDASSEIPARDRVDNTAEVEAVAANANPTQEQIDQYNRDEAEMIDSSNSPAPKTIGTGTFVAEGGQTIVATYLDNGTVSLVLADGSTKVLPQAVSGSGARYAADGFEWWEHQGEATYSVADKEVFSGKLKE